MRRSLRYALSTIFFSLFLLTACGGGGTQVAGGVGTGGTGVVAGTVTGFGSLIMDGTAFNSATPHYLSESLTSVDATVSAIKVPLGAQLDIQLDSQGNPSAVLIDPELVGSVSAISLATNSFTVNGMTVVVNSSTSVTVPETYFLGYSNGLLSISVGDQVLVHGTPAVTAGGMPYIQASLVRLKPVINSVTRVTGEVSNLDIAHKTFQVNGISFSYTGSTIWSSLVPNYSTTPNTLSNGQWVNVWSVAPQSPSPQVAGAIQVYSFAGSAGTVTLSGLVSQWSGSQFQVAGCPILLSANLAGTTLLSDGEYVTVSGTVNSASGAITAQKILPYAPAINGAISLSGTITEFITSANFSVRGVSVVTNTATQVVNSNGSPQSLSTLVEDDFISVTGSIVGNTVLASQITVYSAPPVNEVVDYIGTVGGYNPAGGATLTLTLPNGSHKQVSLSSEVSYTNGAAANLVNGALVEIEATQNADGTLSVYGVNFWNLSPVGLGSNLIRASGVVYGYNSPTQSFNLNGQPVQVGSASLPTGFANGVTVDCLLTSSSGTLMAASIAIDEDN
ncbi:MAG: hypothetical protein G3H99_01420 [Ferrovum sp.]|nr:hypothetical protein [Ferrovum sp.]NDU87037.1 hypothetical protein [Ferrovum sp.]